jgi:hypothetical protein
LWKFLLKQWHDIKGNVKYGILLIVAGAVLTGVELLVHGLTLWQRAGLLFIFAAVLVWAITATVFAMVHSKPKTEALDLPLPAKSLREKVFTLCDELSKYAGERGTRPSEEKLYAQFRDSGKLYAEHYDAKIQSWDDKLSAGYWLKFKDRAVNLRQELVLQDVRDNTLDEALSALERVPGKDYAQKLQTVIEKFRYAASTLR